MKAYFLRRLLLIPLTLLGITIVVFSITTFLPGGPMESSMARLMGGEGGGKRSRAESGLSLTAAQVLEQEEKFDRDKHPAIAYLEWLGALPRDVREQKIGAEFADGKNEVTVTLPGTVQDVTVVRHPDGSAELKAVTPGVDLSRWKVRLRTPDEQKDRWDKWTKGAILAKQPNYRAVVYQSKFSGLLQGSLGTSDKYQDPVAGIIASKIPVSLYFGIMTMMISYGICIPLGILKAIKHRTWIDNTSSIAILIGYAIPGYALGSILLVYLGAKWGVFPIRGFTGDNFDDLSLGGKIADLASHTAMPLACYLVNSFAFLTMLVKNNLMDTLAADYVRTAMAKGVSYPSAVLKHAFRNSLIPLASTFGGIVLILVTGNILIERVFDIDGFGLLQFSSVLEYDRPMVMGTVFVTSLLMLVGNVISDLCVALVDPKVSYN